MCNVAHSYVKFYISDYETKLITNRSSKSKRAIKTYHKLVMNRIQLQGVDNSPLLLQVIHSPLSRWLSSPRRQTLWCG